MIPVKTVVLCALVVALAVNLEAWKSDNIDRARAGQVDAHHVEDSMQCAWGVDWQCNNTHKWYACEGSRECLINEGVAI